MKVHKAWSKTGAGELKSTLSKHNTRHTGGFRIWALPPKGEKIHPGRIYVAPPPLLSCKISSRSAPPLHIDRRVQINSAPTSVATISTLSLRVFAYIWRISTNSTRVTRRWEWCTAGHNVGYCSSSKDEKISIFIVFDTVLNLKTFM